MSEPAEPTAHLPVTDDANDDYLSTSSKESSKEEPMDSTVFETPQNIVDESTHDEKEELLDAVINNTSHTNNERQELIDSAVMETLQDVIEDRLLFDVTHRSLSNVLIPENTSDDDDDDEENELDLIVEHSVISTGSDSDKQMVMISSTSEIVNQQDQSIIGTFYIPDEMENDEHHSNTLQQQVQNEHDQVDISNYQRILNISDTSSDHEPHSETEAISESSSSAEAQFATIPIAELPNYGYELHDIKLMKPTETIPVGFKLAKKTNPLQYIMTVIVEQSKADIAGLKVDDWLIQIEDNDIRLTSLRMVLEDIYRLFNTVGFINMLIARKKSSTTENPPISDENNILSSVGLSNPIEDKKPTPQEYPSTQSIDLNLDKIRHITLKEASGLYFNSFVSADNDQIQIHFVSKIQPISIAYRAGLRNNDRILTVNGIDVTHTSQEDVRLMILKKNPIELTVIKDSKYLESIENFKRNQIQKTFPSTVDREQPKEFNNILFTDDQGPVYIKHCIVKKESSHDALGFLLYHEDSVHVIDSVELNFPAYNSGLRDRDVILFVNKKSVQQLTHDDLTILLRSLVISNQTVDFIAINETNIQRYKNYQRKRCIDWDSILSKIDENPIQTNEKRSSTLYDASSSSLLSGARTCVLETDPKRLVGFTIEGVYPPPFVICKIEKDSSADRAGLQLNDALLSINGKSVLQCSYDETIEIIKEALKQKFVEFVVNQSTIKKTYRPQRGSESSSLSYSSDDDGGSTDDSTIVNEPVHRNTNTVQEYQKQRTKELSYAVRLCHLNTTNDDGTPASSFGFEITGSPEYEYPIITHVESKSPGERSGLQADDILLKVNKRKTKGAAFEKIKKAIDKAKRDGRIEMLVVDKDAFHYCIKTNRKFKEPYIKVKHVFPRSRSSVTYQSLASARAALTSENVLTQSENEEETVNFDVSLSTTNAFPHDISSKFIDPARRLSQRVEPSLINQNTTQEIQNEASTDESIIDFVLNAINNFFQNIGSEKSINLDYDIPPDRTNNSKIYTPLLSTFCPDQSLRKDVLSNVRVDSTASYDYIRDPRRCVIQIDREKGLGFILSANGDYDHTITSVDKNSVADTAGLQIYDEILEINGVDVRNIKYEQVVEMLISSMRTDDTIEMHVINNHVYSSTPDTNKTANTPSLSNDNHNNNNNNNLISAKRPTAVLGNDFLDKNNKISPLNTLKQQTINTSFPNLHEPSKYLRHISGRNLSGSVPALSTGITASPKDFRSIKTTSTSSKKDSISNISKKNAPIARLCRIRKFPSSPFYGFFLCGDAKKLGRVFVSNITKNSSAAICGLRDGDHIIEVNGTNIQTLTYETILNIIKLHMEDENLELLVLDKKSARWYRRRKYPITSQTLPTIVHIEPIINQINSGIQHL